MSTIARLTCGAVLLAACLPKVDIVDSLGSGGGSVDTSASTATSPSGASSGAGGNPSATASGPGAGGGGAGGDGTAGGGGSTGEGGSGGAGGGGTAGTGGAPAGAGGASGGTSGAAGNAGGGAGGRSGSSGASGGGGSSGAGGGTGGATGGKGGAGGATGGAGGAGSGGAGSTGAGGTSVCSRDGGTVGTWADWPMPNAVSSGLLNPQSYDTSTPGVVRDNVTGLYWQRNADASRIAWSAAPAYCASLTLGGCGGWRVPTRIELLSIVDYSRTAPAIDTNAFPNTFQEPFWSSTLAPKPAANQEARYIDFTNGSLVNFDRRGELRIRCVR